MLVRPLLQNFCENKDAMQAVPKNQKGKYETNKREVLSSVLYSFICSKTIYINSEKIGYMMHISYLYMYMYTCQL